MSKPVASPRVKNQADLSQYIKVFKSCMPSWSLKYLNPDPEEVCAQYYDFVDELLDKTPRPVKELMVKACKSVHAEVPLGEISCCMDRLLAVISFLRGKAKSSITGKKLSPKIRALVNKLKKLRTVDPSPSPEKGKVQSSNPSSSSGYVRPASFTNIDGMANESDRASVFAAYGLQPPKAASTTRPLPLEDQVLEIGSDLSEEQDEKPAVALEWFDSHAACQKRTLSNGKVETAVMSQGSSGFLIAKFPGEAGKQLEVPNIVLLPVVMKKPSAAMKRPAAAMEKETAPNEFEDVDADAGDDEAEAETAEPPELPTKVFFKYSNPYKYPNGSFAIRRTGNDSKKQICSVKSSNLSDDEVRAKMQDLTRLLNSGKVAESEAPKWVSKYICGK